MENALIISLLIVWILSLFGLIGYYVKNDDPAQREQNDVNRYMAYRDEVKTKRSVWQRAGVPPPGDEFSPIVKGLWAWVLLTLIGVFLLSGFNIIVGIAAIICASFINKGMGWNI